MNNLDHVKIEQEEKCECNWHLGMGPNLKCKVHGPSDGQPKPIKSIDEYEWSCPDVFDFVVNCNGEVCFDVVSSDGWSVHVNFNDADLSVLANARGFDLVERGDK